MSANIKPPCKRCGHIYLHGRRGICSTCLSRQRRGPGTPLGERRLLKCKCNKPATTVILASAGYDEEYILQIPVCEDCLKLEQEDEGKPPPEIECRFWPTDFTDIHLDIKPKNRVIEYKGWWRK